MANADDWQQYVVPEADNDWRKLVAEPADKTAKSAAEPHMPEYAPPDEGTLGRIGRLGKQYAGELAKKPVSVTTPFREAATSAGEAGLSLATGTLASVLGGLRGIASPLTGEDAAEAVRSTQQALTYEPRTTGGKVVTETLGAPIALAAELGGKAGGAIGGLVGEKSRAAGEEIGKALPQMAAAALPGVKAFRSARASSAAETPIAGETYSPLRELTPEQHARLKRQTEQGVKPTLASVTREPEQFRFEEQVAQMTDSEAGRAMRQRQVDNEQAVMQAIKNVDRLQTEKAGIKPSVQGEAQTGTSIVDALKRREETEWKQVGELYDKARASGETKQIVDSNLLDNWLNKQKAEAFSVKELGTIRQKVNELKKTNAEQARRQMGSLSVEEAQLLKGMSAEQAKKLAQQRAGFLTVDDMEQIYRTANAISEPGKPSAKMMRNVKNIINQMTAGKGGDLYREARQARLNFGRKWEDQKSVADLIGTKRGYPLDPKVAPENVFKKTVLGGSLQDLQNVTRTLMNGDLKQFPEGPQAMRNMQMRTIDHLIEKSIPAAADMDNPRLAATAFRREVSKIGRDKLNHLLGKDAVDKLYDSIRTMQETQTKPGRAVGSETYLNFKMEQKRNLGKMAAEHLIGELPFIARIPAKLGMKKWEKRIEEKARKTAMEEGVSEALTPHRAPAAEVTATARSEKAARRLQQSRTARPMAAPLAIGAESAQQERIRREREKQLAMEQAFQ